MLTLLKRYWAVIRRSAFISVWLSDHWRLHRRYSLLGRVQYRHGVDEYGEILHGLPLRDGVDNVFAELKSTPTTPTVRAYAPFAQPSCAPHD